MLKSYSKQFFISKTLSMFLSCVSVFLSLLCFKTEIMCINLCSYRSFFFFFGLLPTTEAMGIWRFAGAFAVAERQSECGRKNPLNALQPPTAHRRVLGVGIFLFAISVNRKFANFMFSCFLVFIVNSVVSWF